MRIAVFACVLLLAACSQDDPKADLAQSGPPQSSTTTDATPQMAESSTNAMNPTANVERDEPSSRPSTASPTQEVHLIEYAVHMPDTVPAGRVSFNIENGGKEKHAFEIEGNGVEEKTGELTRGDTASMTLTLKPGTYTVYCPMPGHAEKGMKRVVRVE
jgi:uncharacterized cupredoxin-like copper-binding protein